MAGYPCNIVEVSNFCKKNNIILSAAAVSAVAIFGIILTI